MFGCAGGTCASVLLTWGVGFAQGACLESCEPLMNWVILMQGPNGFDGLHLYDNEVGPFT